MLYSAIYAAVLALWLSKLSFNVIKLRVKHRVALGDGEQPALRNAIAAQANAAEYIPICLLLLFALEYNQGHWLLVHLSGVLFVTGRLIHAQAINSENIKRRVLGMYLTFGPIVVLAASNLVYVAIAQF